jgi:hypothetical protein
MGDGRRPGREVEMVRIRRGMAVVIGSAAATAVGLALTTVSAGAVSGGGYDPAQLHCSKTADRNDQPNTAQKGCKNFVAQVNQGGGSYARQWHLIEINTDQTPVGTSAHSGAVVVDPGQGTAYSVNYDTGQGKTADFGTVSYPLDVLSWIIQVITTQQPSAPPLPKATAPQPGAPSLSTSSQRSKGHIDQSRLSNIQVYMGADDNLDGGEHDGINPNPDPAHPNRDKKVANGPSDGGAIQLNTHLQGSPSNPSSLGNNVSPTDTHNPLRAADAGFGACADGVCFAADTTHRRAYKGGCKNCPDRAVYDDQNNTDWRSPNCNSGDTASQNQCGSGWNQPGGSASGPITQPYNERGSYYTDPGVMIYEDPDPQASPVLPMYPICEEYFGTQGIWLCGMNVVPAPAAGSTNAAAVHSPSAGTNSAPTGPLPPLNFLLGPVLQTVPAGALPPLNGALPPLNGALPPLNGTSQPQGVLPPLNGALPPLNGTSQPQGVLPPLNGALPPLNGAPPTGNPLPH